ncbi:phage integrase family protein [Escherichia coli 7-233-03_S4_C2]|nr:phage integrase family protein [Escherichia coli 7-233-03_S4_C2]
MHAIGWVKHKCIPGAKWPEIQAEMRIWKKRREGERKETGKYTSVVDLARARANQQYTENSTGKISPVIAAIHREYKQTWKTLDDELAYALWPGNVDAGNIDGSIHRWAKKEVIDNDREDWKRISASMRKQPDALRYDRQTIFGLVRERPIDIHKDPVALNKYICEYLADNPFKGISPLKESRTIPDPLSREEFIRLIDACRNQQAKNLWCVSVYTGVRPGELCALGWEDIDLKNGTMMIRRNLAKDRFTVPKTQAGTNRGIHLIKPAIDALRSQMTLTRLSKEHIIDVHLREYGRTEKQKCTFVFQPEVSARVKNYGDHFTVDSIRQMWDAAIKRAGLRHRKSYQSRHTYACWSLTAGANPAFIANQMGHADAQMVFQVYGKWMSENNNAQVALLNTQLSEFAPTMPHNESMKN